MAAHGPRTQGGGKKVNAPAGLALTAPQIIWHQLGVTVHYPGLGWYEALDGSGLVRYRWRHVDELLQQLRGAMELPEMTFESDDTHAARPNGKGRAVAEKAAKPRKTYPSHNPARSWVEPGIAQITYPSGTVRFEAAVTVGGRTKGAGRHPTLEAARQARDRLLAVNGRSMRVRKGKTSAHVEPVPATTIPCEACSGAGEFRNFDNGTTKPCLACNGTGLRARRDGIVQPVDLDANQATLLRLFAAAQEAERHYREMRGSFAQTARTRQEAWAALGAFIEASQLENDNYTPALLDLQADEPAGDMPAEEAGDV